MTSETKLNTLKNYSLGSICAFRVPFWGLFLACGLLWWVDAARAAQPADVLHEQVDALFATWNQPDTPGAAVAILRDGMVEYARGYGMANLEHRVPITPATVFDIASVSKQFAGLAVAMLATDGRLALDADVRTYLPEFPDFGRPVTVRHLVHHTSGLRDWPGALALAGWSMEDVISFEQIMDFTAHQRTLNFDPGAEYLYSNTGYNVLAALVERVTGESFRDWTDTHLFKPLGMVHTHFRDDREAIIPDRAYGYAREDEGYRRIGNGLTALGSSSLFTTVDDLARWVRNFDDPRVGGADALALMHRRGVLNDGTTIAYAFGQSVDTYRGVRRVSHSGSWAGFRTYLVRFPEERLAVIVLSNASTFDASDVALAVADLYLADHLTEQPDEERPTAPVAVDARTLDAYVGTYALNPSWLLTVTREGDALMVQATLESRFPMRAEGTSRFFVDAYGAAVAFHRDGEGPASSLTYRGMLAPRVEPAIPRPDALHVYEGTYVSEELDTSYRIVLEDGRLVAHHVRNADVSLSPTLTDHFAGSAWFMRFVSFDRDTLGRISEMRISSGRVRDVRFVRRGE